MFKAQEYYRVIVIELVIEKATQNHVNENEENVECKGKHHRMYHIKAASIKHVEINEMVLLVFVIYFEEHATEWRREETFIG